MANVRRYIFRKKENNPAEYRKFSERINRLLEDYRKEKIEYRKLLAEIAKLGKELKGDVAVVDPRLDTEAKRSLCDNLGGNADLALKVFEAVGASAKPGFRRNAIRRRKVELAIEDALQGTDFNPLAVYQIVEHQSEFDADSYMKATSALDSGAVAWIGRVGNNSYYKGFADLGGHDLSVRVQTGRKFGLANTTLENGGLKIIQGGQFTTTNKVVATNNVLVSAGCAMDIGGSFAVSNYTHNTAHKDTNNGASDVDVYGTFTPHSSGCFHGSTMHDGSIIDLSGLSASLNAIAPFKASTTGAKTLHFAPGATVGVRVGGRKKLHSTPLITWTASEKPDPSVKFVRADADRKYSLVVKDDGLYYVGQGLIISFF